MKQETVCELLDLINENDEVIGVAPREEIRKKRLLHRGVSVFVFNAKGEIFVHKRTQSKKIYPGLYDLVCGGAVSTGEDFEEAAKRETTEELGIIDPKLKYLFKHRYASKIANAMIKVYSCTTRQQVKIQVEEIVSGAFMTLAQLEKEIKTKRFCPDSVEIFMRYKSML